MRSHGAYKHGLSQSPAIWSLGFAFRNPLLKLLKSGHNDIIFHSLTALASTSQIEGNHALMIREGCVKEIIPLSRIEDEQIQELAIQILTIVSKSDGLSVSV